jgi:hypothetical protein
MKKLIFTCIALSLAIVVKAQKLKESDVPLTVKSAFQQKFTTASDVEWEKEDGQYEVEFKLNQNEQSVLYSAEGKLLETEIEILLSQLPVGVLDYVNQNYAGKKAKEASKITSAQGVETYEVEIKGSDLIFDSAGKFLSEKKD